MSKRKLGQFIGMESDGTFLLFEKQTFHSHSMDLSYFQCSLVQWSSELSFRFFCSAPSPLLSDAQGNATEDILYLFVLLSSPLFSWIYSKATGLNRLPPSRFLFHPGKKQQPCRMNILSSKALWSDTMTGWHKSQQHLNFLTLFCRPRAINLLSSGNWITNKIPTVKPCPVVSPTRPYVVIHISFPMSSFPVMACSLSVAHGMAPCVCGIYPSARARDNSSAIKKMSSVWLSPPIIDKLSVAAETKQLNYGTPSVNVSPAFLQIILCAIDFSPRQIHHCWRQPYRLDFMRSFQSQPKRPFDCLCWLG